MRTTLSALVVAAFASTRTTCCTDDRPFEDAVAANFNLDPRTLHAQPLPYQYSTFTWNNAHIEVYKAKFEDEDFFRILNGAPVALSTNQPVGWTRVLYFDDTHDFYLILSDKDIPTQEEATLNGLAVATYPR